MTQKSLNFLEIQIKTKKKRILFFKVVYYFGIAIFRQYFLAIFKRNVSKKAKKNNFTNTVYKKNKKFSNWNNNKKIQLLFLFGHKVILKNKILFFV